MTSTNALSFLPDDYLAARRRRRTHVFCGALFLVSAAAVGTGFSLAHSALTRAEKHLVDVDRRYTDAAKRIRQATQIQQKQRTLARQAELTAALLEKVPRSNVLAAVTNALPEGASLTDMNLTSRKRDLSIPNLPGQTALDRKLNAANSPGNPLSGLPPMPVIYDVSVRLAGRAVSNAQVASFMRQLEQSELFSGVTLVSNQQSEKTGDTIRKFVLEAVLTNQPQLQREAPATRTASAE